MAITLKSWLLNEVWKHCCLVLWMAATTFVFCRTFLLYYYGPEYYYLHKMLGLGLCISRASASAINLNCALILLPMCRSSLALLRRSRTVTSRATRRLLDRNKAFHVTCGVAVMVFTGVHCAAHMVNAWNFSAHHSARFPEINVARYRHEDPRKILFTTVPGVTGMLMVIILFLIGTSSTRQIRVTSYNVFWYTHSLYLAFFLLLLLHATGGVLKVQTNLQEHPPGCYAVGSRGNDTTLPGVAAAPEPLPEGFAEPEPGMVKNSGVECRELPKFQSQIPEAWLWVSGPLCLYCAERVYRLIRSSRAVTVTAAARHPGNVLEICMLRPGFTARPGQYVLLHCPSVSTFESHPFTLTQCPPDSKGNFAIHLRVLGDWTASLQDQLFRHQNTNSEHTSPPPAHYRYPKLYVDGPFGSPAEEVFNYRVSLCVAGGIGVTPFAAVLNALLQQWSGARLRRLYLVWVCKEARDFGWLASVLAALHAKLWQENRPDFFSVRLFTTTRSGSRQKLEDKYQALNSRMSVGRPCWTTLFGEIAQCNRRTSVGVFCCGPQKMSRAVHRVCNRCSAHGTSFHYNKESFG